MSKRITVTLPDNIAKGVMEEMVIEYYKQGYSIKKFAEMTGTPI